MPVDRPTVVISGWQAAAVLAALLVWVTGDFLLLQRIGGEALDCLATDGQGRSGAFEAIVCHPLLLGQGAWGVLAFLWIWAPIVSLTVWMRRRAK